MVASGSGIDIFMTTDITPANNPPLCGVCGKQLAEGLLVRYMQHGKELEREYLCWPHAGILNRKYNW